MGWEVPVLRQDTINGCAKRGGFLLFGYISKQMIQSKVAGNTVALLPILDILSDNDYFSSHIRAWDKI